MDINQEGGDQEVFLPGPAAERIHIFNTDEKWENWRLVSEHLGWQNGWTGYKATVYDETNTDLPIRTAHAWVKPVNKDQIQTAETVATGRVLGYLGIKSKHGIATKEEMDGLDIKTPEQKEMASIEAILNEGKQ